MIPTVTGHLLSHRPNVYRRVSLTHTLICTHTLSHIHTPSVRTFVHSHQCVAAHGPSVGPARSLTDSSSGRWAGLDSLKNPPSHGRVTAGSFRALHMGTLFGRPEGYLPRVRICMSYELVAKCHRVISMPLFDQPGHRVSRSQEEKRRPRQVLPRREGWLSVATIQVCTRLPTYPSHLGFTAVFRRGFHSYFASIFCVRKWRLQAMERLVCGWM